MTRPFPALLALLLATLPLAGCLGDEPQDAAATGATADGPSAAPPGADVETPAGGAMPGAAAAVAAPFAWDGMVGRGACLPAGPNSCTSPVPLGDGDQHEELAGNVTRLALNLTWDAAAPTTDELYFGAFVYKSCGEGCFESFGDMFEATGPSPLSIVGEMTLAPGEGVGVFVGVPGECQGAAVVFACASAVEQPFSVEGLVWTAGSAP